MPDGSLASDIAALLDVPPSRAAEIRLEPCATGGNNRVYVATLDERKWVVKQYFRHPGDTRNRLQSERAFLNYATGAGIACVPRVIACDSGRGIGVYEFIEGRKLVAGEINGAVVHEAAEFFCSLNDAACRSSARELPAASEACFSTADHFAMVDSRLAKLDTVAVGDETGRAARQFVGELRARWGAVKSEIRKVQPGRSLEAEVPERCISPSDFGFHNAIARLAGPLCFVDFEYAGWDDPAKMAGDFFSHPAVPVPRDHFESFVRRTMGFSRHSDELVARAHLLLPIFQTKWCCIILNEFVPLSAQRRRFANPELDEDARRREQLGKARTLFEKI